MQLLYQFFFIVYLILGHKYRGLRASGLGNCLYDVLFILTFNIGLRALELVIYLVLLIYLLYLGHVELRLDNRVPTLRSLHYWLLAIELYWWLHNLDRDTDCVTFTPLVPSVVLYESEQEVFNREEFAANRTTELVA